MKSRLRQSVGKITAHTPMSVRKALGPALNPLLAKLLAGAGPAEPEAKGYVVRPRHAPAVDGPRILHVIGNFMTGGSSRLVVDLYERLCHRYVQHVAAQFVPPEPAYIGIPVTEIRQRESSDAMVALIRDFRPHLIHVHYWGDCDTPWYERAFEAARATGCPVIENVNTPVAPFLAPEVREYVYVSDYVRKTFGAGVEGGVTIYPGSDFEMFRPSLLPLRPNGRVGMVYRLEPDKLDPSGIEPMIEAARLSPDLRFVVVGGGTFFDEYRKRVAAAGFEARFEFPGYVAYKVLRGYYRDMAMFVAPVWKESFGQVSSFAMSMGLPVVGYDVGAIGEIVADASLLAPPADSAALGRIIAELMADPARRKRIGARNRQRAAEFFSVEAMVEAYDRLYATHLPVSE